MKMITATLAFLLFQVSVHAQEWVRQNPFANLSQLYDIDFDGKYGLAVGADATIFATTDGGITWNQQKASPYARTIESAKVVPGTKGEVMIAGGDSILMVTENGGEFWKTSFVEIPNVYKIQVLPGNVWIALGKDYGVVSFNEGDLWTVFKMPAFGVTAGHFINSEEGWVAQGEPDNMRVWYTDDRGIHWELRDPQVFPLVNGMEMFNDTVGLLASRDHVYKTIDGGFTWWPLNTIATNHIQDLFVIDEDNLWTSLDNGEIYFSTNGGSQWEQINPGVIHANRALGIWATKTGKIWTVGKYMSILHSPDFGQTWTDQLPGMKETLFEPSFYNAFTGMVGGSDGVIMKTSNSGATWETIRLPDEINEFYGTAMTDDSTVIAGSYGGRVLISSDLGSTWETIGQDLGKITDLHAFNEQHILITNKEGEIYRTTNGGNHWEKVYDGAQGLLSLHFYNTSLGWATGLFGRIIKTTNGGTSWTVQAENFHHEFSDAFFTSPADGWVTSYKFSDSLWHTVNGGITWESILLPVKAYWHGVSFMDSDTGWVVGGIDGKGYILRTNDQGQTWSIDHISPDAFMGVFNIPNSETAWAVGFGGNIMKFSSCAFPPALIEIRGNLQPCTGDTINYIVEFDDVDIFEWTYPSDWHVVGNTNTASIHFVAGETPGIVTVRGMDACGDTTEQLLALVEPVMIDNLTVTEDNGILAASATFGIFDWYLNGVQIPGAHDPTFRPTVNGNYVVHYTTFTSGCEAFSNVFNYHLFPGVFEDEAEFTTYPNPATDFIYIHGIDGTPLPEKTKVMISGLDGRVLHTSMLSRDRIDLPSLPPGLYSLTIQSNETIRQKTLMIE